MQVLISIISAFLLLFTSSSFAAQTEFSAHESNGAKSRVLASFYEEKIDETSAAKKFILGIQIDVEKGWHIYAPDDSGFGIVPYFSFVGSQNIDSKSANPLFPKSKDKSEKIGSDVIKYKVYEDEVIIPIEISVIDAAKDINLELELNYGLCKEICIPASQKFSLIIPSGSIDDEALGEIQKYLGDKKIIDELPQKSSGSLKISLAKALVIAFIGGLILNIMPCVLPVLSIKLIGIIDHAKSRLIRVRFAFFSTIIGIIFCFLIFAFVTIFLKSIGNSVGWGLQFQNPYFLLFLLIVLMVFTANLCGLFEFHFSSEISTDLNKKIDETERKRKIFIPNFLSGILTVLLATPCSAPFVGVAISFALSSGTIEIFLIFISMAFGLAFPYVLLFIYPKAIRYLPRPGKWMARVKNLMAGFLFATAIWVVYVLMENLGFLPAIAAAILSILILLFFKIVHKSQTQNQSKPKSIKKIFAQIFIFILIIASIFIVPNRLMHLSKMMEKMQNENWVKFDEEQIPNLVLEGKTVVVDITADWCLTCKANKLLVLNSEEIKAKLRDENIIGMRGDLTKPDEKIFNFLKKYNRYGIPFNIVFGPSAPNGILTSELLSKEALLDAINKASKDNQLNKTND